MRRFLIVVAVLLVGCSGWTIEGDDVAVQPGGTVTSTPLPTPIVTATATPLPLPTATSVPLGSPTPLFGPTTTAVNAQTPLPGGPEPSITYFTATPQTVRAGEEVLLFWVADNGQATISQLDAEGNSEETWVVDLEGSLSVTPSIAVGQQEYVLSVTAEGLTAESSLLIEVEQSDCIDDWMITPPDNACALTPPRQVNGSQQSFERGQMLYFDEQIVVLFDETGENEPAWVIYPDTFEAGDPESNPEIVPPEGFFQPERGFGEVWRDVPGIRDRLGWATAEEVAFITITQLAELNGIQRRLISTATGEVYQLVADGDSWSTIGQITPP